VKGQKVDLEELHLTDLRWENALFGMLKGTEQRVNNHVYDKNSEQEYERFRQEGRTPSIIESITETNNRNKNFLKKNDRFRLSLEMQSFKNYIPINIPIFEIFVKKNYEAPATNLFYVNDRKLLWSEEFMDLTDLTAEERKHQSSRNHEAVKLTTQYQKKMMSFLDKPD
jgi:hypothetical protein